MQHPTPQPESGIRTPAGAAGGGPAGALSDEAVVRRVLSGDIASFELIMRRYNQRLFRVVRGIVVDDAAAEDVVQEAYLRAYDKLSSFQGRSSFATWLTKIAVYQALADRRDSNRAVPVEEQALEAADARMRFQPDQPLEHATNHELGRVLADAIDNLPDDLRVVFMMRMVEELDTHETARCLDLSESNVKVRLHRARSLLQERIDRQIGVEARKLYQFDGRRCDRLVNAVLGRLTR
jgi:RNA polymerase sigma-70 factor (ECF subfamily)